jgi:hypothetical protein
VKVKVFFTLVVNILKKELKKKLYIDQEFDIFYIQFICVDTPVHINIKRLKKESIVLGKRANVYKYVYVLVSLLLVLVLVFPPSPLGGGGGGITACGLTKVGFVVSANKRLSVYPD